ncbi:MAG: XdhC family protein [Thermoleophilia bacterium]|nr:XdhC family protein [Thermoleophilia bacterium]
MRDVASTVWSWLKDGHDVAIATVTRTRRSSPRLPGSAMALCDDGRIAGSVTGGCVEPDVIARAAAIIAGASPELVSYGIADADAFEVGLPCGGEVEIMIEPATGDVFERLASAIEREDSVAYVTVVSGPDLGTTQCVALDSEGDLAPLAVPMLERACTAVIEHGANQVLVHSIAPRPAMYVFGAIDFASALAEAGHFLGYRVIVCDPREAFVTPARFPVVDELVSQWPHEFLESAPVDARTAICVLTHDEKFDVPALEAALRTPAGYIGAMGSRRTTDRRRERLLADGVTEEQLERVHAPIGLQIGSQTPAEVAIAIVAEIVREARTPLEVADEAPASV